MLFYDKTSFLSIFTLLISFFTSSLRIFFIILFIVNKQKTVNNYQVATFKISYKFIQIQTTENKF